jgi:hypothetical protein
MRTSPFSFDKLSSEIERVNALREAVQLDAFDSLVMHQVHLAEMLLAEFGDRHRAAKWMASHHRLFGGRTAYQVLADMDEPILWEALERRGQSESDGATVCRSHGPVY